jgi:CRISPR/Cas system-associated exonuclease Cas4 (RecB family)
MTSAARAVRQLALLGDDGVPEAPPPSARTDVAPVTWSYSRRSTLEQCARRYYYQYFGGNKRLARNDPDKETLHFLKVISNRFERSGSLMHLAVSRWLRALQRGESRDMESLIRWVSGIFAADRAFSRQYPDGDGPQVEGSFPPVLLREFHYRHPDAEQLCDEAANRMLTALRGFPGNLRFAAFQAGASTPDAIIEGAVRLRTLPCKIEGRIDLAYRQDGRVVVVDWKLSEASGNGDESLQLAVYALWAIEHFGCDPSSLEIYKGYLLSGEVVMFRLDPAILVAAKARVVQDAERMIALEAYGRDGVTDAFTPCAHPAVCSLCPFQRVCPEGRRFLDA